MANPEVGFLWEVQDRHGRVYCTDESEAKCKEMAEYYAKTKEYQMSAPFDVYQIRIEKTRTKSQSFNAPVSNP